MKNNQSGLINEILIIIVVLIILGYFFHINITTVLSNSTVQANLQAFWNFILYLWSFIAIPVLWLWNLFLSFVRVGVHSAAVNAVQSVASSTM